MTGYTKQIFICINERPPENPKRCCGSNGIKIRARFVQELAKRKLLTTVRANKSGCLDACSLGPSVVIYPGGIWYFHVTEADVSEIVETSIVNNEIVKRLQISDLEWEDRNNVKN